jgi:3-methylcrotonyl-CoA carboxylase alpha subunit
LKTFRIGDETVAVSAAPAPTADRPNAFRVTIGDVTSLVDAVPTADGRLDLRLESGARALVSVVRTPDGAWVSGLGFNLAAREVRQGASAASDAAGGLEAPMPGKVVAIKAVVGDVVEKGATLLTVEAMKMEHAIKAPRRGRVASIPVAVGELVSPGRPLATLVDAEEAAR